MNNYFSLFDRFNEQTYQFLLSLNLSDAVSRYANIVLLAAVTLVASWLIDKTVNLIATRSLRSMSNRRFGPFFLALIRNKVIRKTANLIPLIVFYHAIPGIFRHFPAGVGLCLTLVNILIIWISFSVFKNIFRSLTDVAETKPGFRDKPLESYQQVVSIILNFLAIILVFSQVTGKEVWTLFTALGAMSAILLLVFKDTIMGFVASVQVTTNDMVRIGDWIEMPKYGADGDVVEITLATVKVQNFDKTVTTVPTYALISDSFKNWRGMIETGGRRIKRAVNLKMSSVKFLSEAQLDRLMSVQLLEPYLKEKRAEISEWNRRAGADILSPVNGRNLTNAGLFRQYISLYLKNHPKIHQNMTAMVRQLAPTETGLPLELYVFTNTTVWVEYEGIMADLFDHVIATAPYFELEIFEQPTGRDMKYAFVAGNPGSIL